AHSQCPPRRTRRRKHAPDTRQTGPEGLTNHHRRWHKSIGQRGSRPGRHHSVTVGDIIQESRATSSHYTRATSSESAAQRNDATIDEILSEVDRVNKARIARH